MIFKRRSNYMLKYEKAKAKLIEFNIAKEDYPHFQLDSNDLIFTTLFALSRYCEELIERPNSEELTGLFADLTTVSQYYDAAVKSKQHPVHDNLFLLLGATAYFLSENFGSAKVLIEQICNWTSYDNIIDTLYITLHFLLLGKENHEILRNESYAQYFNSIRNHFVFGNEVQAIFDSLTHLKNYANQSSNMLDITYIDFLYGVSLCAIKHSSWILLPEYSTSTSEEWSKYLSQTESVKLLWPAQKVVLKAGVLKGKDIIVPLPTGVGKTKSIELLLRSLFMRTNSCVALVIAPLRALCNEIALDLMTAFSNTIVINQFTDTTQEDFDLNLLLSTKYVFICTPEKFFYILRHEPDFLSAIKLFIFDEAHLFDDDARGTQYELLISEIARSRDKNSQMVMFSAVLSNANQISGWLFNDTSAIIDYSLVKSTEKAIGFLSSDQTIHYYEKDDMSEESFYVPRSVKITQLKLRSKERNARIFPENNPQDLAIYYAVNLCKQNGAAIFAGQARSIPPIMRRIVEIENRGYNLSGIIEYGNAIQIDKLYQLLRLHYGESSELVNAAKIGVFPHYANLPNGIKMAIEYALRKRYIYLVVCTTTLAEGINIPIKYLILSTFSYGNSKIQVRKMQNLIGRTARSGIHTEGSAIITDTKYFDNQSTWKNGGKYRWDDCKKMFDYNSTEACISTILRLVNGLQVDYNNTYRGDSLATYLIEHYNTPSCFSDLKKVLKDNYKKRVSQSIFDRYNPTIDQKIDQLEHILENIENYLCYIYNAEKDLNQFDNVVEKLASSTFAFYLADKEQKEYIKRIFLQIGEKIKQNVKNNDAVYFAKSLYGIKISRRILQWVDINLEFLGNYQSKELLMVLTNLFVELFPEQISISIESFTLILEKWISGELYINIYDALERAIAISQIEKLCINTISYNLCFLIGNIIDAVGDRSEDVSESLAFIQKQVKYGTPNRFRTLICENIFDDRYIANLLEKELKNPIGITNEGQLKHFVKAKQHEILTLLKDYPEYFTYKFKMYSK